MEPSYENHPDLESVEDSLHLGEIDSPLAIVDTGTLACLGMLVRPISESTR